MTVYIVFFIGRIINYTSLFKFIAKRIATEIVHAIEILHANVSIAMAEVMTTEENARFQSVKHQTAVSDLCNWT